MSQALVTDPLSRDGEAFQRGQTGEVGQVGIGEVELDEIQALELAHPPQVRQARPADPGVPEDEGFEPWDLAQGNQTVIRHLALFEDRNLDETTELCDISHCRIIDHLSRGYDVAVELNLVGAEEVIDAEVFDEPFLPARARAGDTSRSGRGTLRRTRQVHPSD